MKVKPYEDIGRTIESLSRSLPKDLIQYWPKGLRQAGNLFLHEPTDKPDNQVIVADAGQAAPVRNMRGTVSFYYPRVEIMVRHLDETAAEETCDWIYRDILHCWIGRPYSRYKEVEEPIRRLDPDKGRSLWAFTFRLEMRP